MPTHKQKLINLISQNDFESSTLGRILKWALSTFRVMVIVTELVVMSAFLSRFWLDSRNSDLNEEIDISKSQIIAYQEIENSFRSLQKKLSISKSIYNDTKPGALLSNVTKYIPDDVVLNSISRSENQLTIKASSFSERAIAQFLTNLESYKDLSDISLSQVTSNFENSSATSFTVTAKTNSSGGKTK